MALNPKETEAWAKLSKLHAGDQVKVTGFDCMDEGSIKSVHYAPDGLWILCDHGHHYLDGQLDADDNLVGIYPA